MSARTLQYVDQVKIFTAEKERIGVELNMATEIQASQLPRQFPAFPDRTEFSLYASMNPAREVGGDFYDFYLVDDDYIAIYEDTVFKERKYLMILRCCVSGIMGDGESSLNPAKTPQLYRSSLRRLFRLRGRRRVQHPDRYVIHV